MKKHIFTEPKPKNVLFFYPTAEFYFSKGVEAFRRNDLSKAKKYLTRAWNLEPDEPVIPCQLAIVLAELGEFHEANKILFRILNELKPNMYECHYFLANNYAYMGNFHLAMEHAKKYLQYAPDGEYARDTKELLEIVTMEADENKGHCMNLDGEMEYEEELIEKQEYSRGLLEKGEFDEASVYLRQMIEEYPTFWPAYNNLSIACFYQGKTEEAYQLLEKVLKENPGNLHALCNMALFHYYEGKDYTKLLEALKKVHPISVDHRYKLAVTFIILKQYEQGYALLKKLLNTGIQAESIFYYWFSYAAYMVGNVTAAENAWKKFVIAEPDKEGCEPWKSNHQPQFTK